MHYFTLNFICHSSDHSINLVRSVCRICCSSTEEILAVIFVSSANFSILLDTVSCMYITNKHGPKTDPCGTPLRTGSQSDVALLTMTLCFLSVSQHFIHLDIFPPIPFAAIFSINLRCGTLSKALAKSRYSVSTGTPLSISDVTCSR